jgi:DNA invertase Pin-like site-specific DNA recombinase
MVNHNNKPRAAILARCSDEGNVCSQILTLKQYAADKYLVDDEDIYGDNIGGQSDFSERLELRRLMQNIEEGKKQYSIVLVQDEARLGKVTEQVSQIKQWFSDKDITLYFLKG